MSRTDPWTGKITGAAGLYPDLPILPKKRQTRQQPDTAIELAMK